MDMTKDDQSASAGRLDADDLEKASLDTVYEKLSTSPEGLTAAEAKARIENYGRNELVEKEVSNLEKFLRFFWGPIAWMIEAAALLSLLMGHWADLTIILVLLFYNAISGFWQERKASDALAALKAGMAPKATALRDGQFAAIDAAEVVPGDVVRIKLGEVVPADVRFIDGDYISIDQAALTGESLPVRIPRHSATCSTNIRPAIPPAFGHPFHGHSAGAVGAKRRRWVIVTRRVRSASTSGRGVCASTRL
jgi:H+-transporting ATPase